MAALNDLVMCILNAAGVAFFLSKLTSKQNALIKYFILAFAADMITPGRLEFLSYPVMIIVLTVYLLLKKQSPHQAILYVSTTIVAVICSILFVSGFFMAFLPDFVGSMAYDYIVGCVQAAEMILLAYPIRRRLKTELPPKARQLVISSECFFIIVYTLVIPNLITILNLNESNSMRVLYAAYGYFSIGMIVFVAVLLIYLSRIERINTYRKIKLHNYMFLYQHLVSYLQTPEKYPYAQWIEQLDRLHHEQLRYCLFACAANAEKQQIKVRITIPNDIDLTGISNAKLQEALHYYFAYATSACKVVNQPEIWIFIEANSDSIFFKMKNTVLDTKETQRMIETRTNKITNLMLLSRLLAKQPNIEEHMYAEDGWFYENILIYNREVYDGLDG